MPAAQGDRYEPLPGVLELPGWLFRKLSRRGKLFTSTVIALLAAGIAVALALLIPVITQTKHDNAARERREAAAFRRERIAQLTRESRAHRGALAAPLTESAALTRLQDRIATDVAARERSRELTTPVKRVDCSALNHGNPLFVSCVAVTSDIPGGEVSRGGRVGYPFRAKVSLRSGRYAFCRQSGRPGEGSLGTGVHVALPAACGG